MIKPVLYFILAKRKFAFEQEEMEKTVIFILSLLSDIIEINCLYLSNAVSIKKILIIVIDIIV